MIDQAYATPDEQLPYIVLQMVRGDNAEFDFSVVNPSTGLPQDCSGGTAKMAAKKSYDDTELVIDIATGSGITWTNASQGKGHVVIPSAQTEVLPNDQTNLVFDLQVTAGGRTWTVSRGRIEVLAQVAT